MKRSIPVALLSGALVAACSNAATTTPPMTAGSAPVTFAVVVPAIAAAAKRRGTRPQFVSPSTQSVVISQNSATLVTIDTSASSKSCKRVASGSRSCSATASARSGKTIFTISSFDGTGGKGNVLAVGDMPATLANGQAAQLGIALTGTPASFALAIASRYPPAGTALTTRVVVSAFDADGNTIVGAYGSAVAIADSDTSGATKLSATSLSNSSTRITLAYTGAPLSQATLTATAASFPAATIQFVPSPTVVAEYTAPPIAASPEPVPAGLADVVVGPDGNLWATASGGGGIEKISSDGHFTVFPIVFSDPVGISAGADGNLWFVEQQTGKVAKITTSGEITAYKIPPVAKLTSQPAWTTPGSDGRTWFVDQGFNIVGAVTSDGKISEYPLPKNSFPNEIVTGPDGNLWITDDGLNTIDVFSTKGTMIAKHPIPTASANPWGIAVGPDKNLWFAEFNTSKIARISRSGAIAEFNVPTALAGPLNVAAGPDGNVWFTESGGSVGVAGKIGYLTTDGSLVRDFAPPNIFHVHALVFDKSGNLWFTQFAGTDSLLGKLVY